MKMDKNTSLAKTFKVRAFMKKWQYYQSNDKDAERDGQLLPGRVQKGKNAKRERKENLGVMLTIMKA